MSPASQRRKIEQITVLKSGVDDSYIVRQRMAPFIFEIPFNIFVRFAIRDYNADWMNSYVQTRVSKRRTEIH